MEILCSKSEKSMWPPPVILGLTCCMTRLGNSLGLTDKCSIGPRMGCWRAPIVYTSTGIYSTVANQPTDARRPEHSAQRLFSSSGRIRVVVTTPAHSLADLLG